VRMPILHAVFWGWKGRHSRGHDESAREMRDPRQGGSTDVAANVAIVSWTEGPWLCIIAICRQSTLCSCLRLRDANWRELRQFGNTPQVVKASRWFSKMVME